ncbi:hypothetical protein HELRODRAFT_175226 [Helobdella robusta]|uniref:Apple domain-containing protein n=1 Tax=Helobdella robusta TaxID=6412 RepID=T1F916_HELRO|nr:hypothetical protein HELRODRAFT_175226 [Helobdella robusta]ESO00750.1 hypothetical protein HELRODRAFT_175226 [Helobdella robusta]
MLYIKPVAVLFLLIIQFTTSGQQEVPTNVALGAYTYNSSAYYVTDHQSLTGSLAVDGVSDGSLCSLTKPEVLPHWIAVDLGNVFKIFFTILYAGTNGYIIQLWNDLNFFIVGVTNRSLDFHPPVGGTYDLCAQYPGVVASKQVVQLNCSSTTPPARYVILQQPSNSTGYMSVCEWEIYGVPYGRYRTNLLLKKPAMSSSSYFDSYCSDYVAKFVVDGFFDNFIFHCHCSNTKDPRGGGNWFMVDMQGSYCVDYVVLTARDYEGGYDVQIIMNRMENFIIGLTNVSSATSPPVRNTYPWCATWPGLVNPGIKAGLKCNANLPKYRYLIAQASATAGDGYFHVCELEAFEPLDRNSLIWKRQANKLLIGFQFNQLYARSAMDCMHKCQQLGGCDSISFHPASKLCQLNAHTNGYTSLTVDPNWSFYTRKKYSTVSQLETFMLSEPLNLLKRTGLDMVLFH